MQLGRLDRVHHKHGNGHGPHATGNRGDGRGLLLHGFELDFDLVRTERPWHAAELAEEAAKDGYSCVVAAGGDGTANEVLNGLMNAKADGADGVAMGVLSVGQGNDFAYS